MAHVIVVGKGAREHALAWLLAQSEKVKTVEICPGSSSFYSDQQNVVSKIKSFEFKDISTLIDHAKKMETKLVVVGPEDYLDKGIVDQFNNTNIPIFGPSKMAAQLETSKDYAKKFMSKNNIPTAQFKSFTDYQEACKYVQSLSHKIVIKVSGLAAGKGVIIPDNIEEAIKGLDQIMNKRAFGDAGNIVIIEERLYGKEISCFAMCSGTDYIMLPSAQDHKRVGENDTGLNTGGMGAICPTPYATNDVMSAVRCNIIEKTLGAMVRDGSPFVGCLFVGIMITENGPQVLEYNVRFGDPETEVLIPLFNRKYDFFELCVNACIGKLDSSIEFFCRNSFSTCVVACSKGYPECVVLGKVITLPSHMFMNGVSNPKLVEKIDDCEVFIFQGGTTKKYIDDKNVLVTSGGRVLTISAVSSESLEKAQKAAYKAISQCYFDGMFYRNDIGQKSIDYINFN